MALSASTQDPAEAILALVRDQFNGTFTITLDDAEYGDYDSRTDERVLLKPATVLVPETVGWIKWDKSAAVQRSGSYSTETVRKGKIQFEIEGDEPFIPDAAIMKVLTHTRDSQLVGQTFRVTETSVSSLIDLRTVIGIAEVFDGS